MIAEQEGKSLFNDLLNYATDSGDRTTTVGKCIAIRTSGVTSIETASAEMNAVASQNLRCTDPAYHFILSWPEHEKPTPEAIFDAAEHAIKALGLGGHQFVLAIHGDTDNMHCHVSVNRVNPITFKSHNIEWAKKTLHLAARQSEIKHRWTHDNGIYLVEIDGHGKKHIVLNPDHDWARGAVPYVHQELGTDDPILDAWSDSESLESWLKSTVTKALKADLADLQSWNALHAWLDKHDITLADSGGGGMRLQATSPETGEILDIAASKGFRFLKRADLEKRWGEFTSPPDVPAQIPDLSHLSPRQLAQGIHRFLTNTPENPTDDPYRPPEHILRAQQYSAPDDVDHASAPRNLNRGDSQRAERKAQRAAARVDLRLRFSQYKRSVVVGDVDYSLKARALRSERSQSLKMLRESTATAKAANRKHADVVVRMRLAIETNANQMLQKLKIESSYQAQLRSIQATRIPPLGWREWLHEQSNLGDKAALSALRGIVYQAKRDAKYGQADDSGTEDITQANAGYQDAQYQKLMERLLDEERRETAIRSANFNQMRPFEVDSLMERYRGVRWRVTGNGNVEYSAQGGEHLFTDRGNRVTFDRSYVSDDDIRLALLHAQQKFGNTLTLTGTDAVFTARMARLADDMGLIILNPEMQEVIAAHRMERQQPALSTMKPSLVAPEVVQLPEPSKVDVTAHDVSVLSAVVEPTSDAIVPIAEKTVEVRTLERGLAIEPRTTLKRPNSSKLPPAQAVPPSAPGPDPDPPPNSIDVIHPVPHAPTLEESLTSIMADLEKQGFAGDSVKLSGPDGNFAGPVVSVGGFHVALNLGRFKAVVLDIRTLDKAVAHGDKVSVKMTEGVGRVTHKKVIERGGQG